MKKNAFGILGILAAISFIFNVSAAPVGNIAKPSMLKSLAPEEESLL